MSDYAQLGQLTCSQNDFKFNGEKKEVKEGFSDTECDGHPPKNKSVYKIYMANKLKRG
jgi:hypothetical protein